MPRIHLCFLWHMHQPFYKDLVTGEYKLPWVRLHSLKDYFGMVKILDEFPTIHQTFNLVPCLLEQIEDYAAGRASDRFLTVALKPYDNLTLEEKKFALQYFFLANEDRQILRYPRYAELFAVMQRCQNNPGMAVSAFDSQMGRDLQVLSQLAWFDEEYLRNDPDISALVSKGRVFTPQEKERLGRKQLECLRNVIPAYRAAAQRGQIEISTTPFYHPILPLLCDSNIAAVSHPYVPLPTQFRYPGDAKVQLDRACAYTKKTFGQAPGGVWPSEGTVSDEALAIAARSGFRWIASDNQVLARTLEEPQTPALTYQPYLWRRNGDQIHIVFRDHRLSDLIGFVYPRMDAGEAAKHFLGEIRTNCCEILAQGKDALVPVILDGENAWENYPENGRPFLRELYGRIAADPRFSALTMSEALAAIPSREISHVFPGSWIDGTFDVWIGNAEDNLAWEHLLAARRTYDSVMNSTQRESLTDEAKRTAWEELLIAEGSDWCWWYGPEHFSANKKEFDQLYRQHLTNVYRLLGVDPPHELGDTFLKAGEPSLHENPSGLIQPVIDGEITSRVEWSGSGRYRIDPRSGAMHSQRCLVQELRYGSDGQYIYLSALFTEGRAPKEPLAFRLHIRNEAKDQFIIFASGGPGVLDVVAPGLPESAVCAALGTIFEMRLSMSALQTRRGERLLVQITLVRDGLPVAVLPMHGELEMQSSELAAYAG
ncbi:MAG TPA: glycoside hydrolase family 57 protein [Bryobacteraceae bacterium]|jgi:alpha-amylase/alpha-mannosidase (GH57 family)|nr:glycoside hydrolase family 57 protein [Bryobacteraceae bacterium]